MVAEPFSRRITPFRSAWIITRGMRSKAQILSEKYLKIEDDVKMRHEYCEKNGIIISYSDTDVAFEEKETARAILISNDGIIIHNNFSTDADKTKYFMEDFARIYPTICYFRSLEQMGDAV